LILFWVLFNLFVLAMLVLDLGVFNRRAHSYSFREALRWSALWVGLAAGFAVLVYFWHGRAASLEFTTGYLIELSLSVDNLFVFLVIFRFFRVPGELQHRVLFWGILGALITRGFFILAGVGLIRRFHWIIYIFGALLVWSGVKLMRQGDTDIDPEKNPVLRMFRRWMPVTDDYVGEKFWAGGGDDRYSVRCRFDSRGTGDHAERLHCVHLERIRDHRAAIDVLRGSRDDGSVRVPALRTVGGADVYWRENAAVALLHGADARGAGNGGGGDRAVGGGVAGVAEEGVRGATKESERQPPQAPHSQPGCQCCIQA
jgi:Integral membrane protein TerC family